MPLINLGKLARGTLVKRPSATVKSPYVADVSLSSGRTKTAAARTVLAHAPSLDVGGMCAAGSEVYLSKRDGEGGKISHSIEMVRGAPLPADGGGGAPGGGGVLVGAHPRLGELIAEEVLKRGLLRRSLTLGNGFEVGPVNDSEGVQSGSPKKPSAKRRKLETKDEDATKRLKPADEPKTAKISLRRQVTLGDSRVEFQMTVEHPFKDASHRVLFEVKNVVCADYEAGTEPARTGPGHCVVVTPAAGDDSDGGGDYERTALFPWGRTRGQEFEGRKVVSERAWKHLRNLLSLLSEDVTPAVLFVVNRSDCRSVRACGERCPVFAEVLEEVVKAGVKALAVRVRWTEEKECFFDGVVPVTV